MIKKKNNITLRSYSLHVKLVIIFKNLKLRNPVGNFVAMIISMEKRVDADKIACRKIFGVNLLLGIFI